MNRRLSLSAAAVIFATMALSNGCGNPVLRADKGALPAPSAEDADETPDQAWRAVRFRIRWPVGKPPDWPVDLLLADRVIRPLLTTHEKNIPLWRFHRRAAGDAEGHRFSFIFYTTRPVAHHIFDQILKNRVLDVMLTANTIEAVRTDDLQFPAGPALEAASDPGWPIELQRAWPAYIMGVCKAWMALIHQHVPGEELECVQLESVQPENLLAPYRKANDAINKTWIEDGQHAFLHHLNAIFGYEPVYIRNMMKF